MIPRHARDARLQVKCTAAIRECGGLCSNPTAPKPTLEFYHPSQNDAGERKSGKDDAETWIGEQEVPSFAQVKPKCQHDHWKGSAQDHKPQTNKQQRCFDARRKP
jgi:hypothetical protein